MDFSVQIVFRNTTNMTINMRGEQMAHVARQHTPDLASLSFESVEHGAHVMHSLRQRMSVVLLPGMGVAASVDFAQVQLVAVSQHVAKAQEEPKPKPKTDPSLH